MTDNPRACPICGERESYSAEWIGRELPQCSKCGSIGRDCFVAEAVLLQAGCGVGSLSDIRHRSGVRILEIAPAHRALTRQLSERFEYHAPPRSEADLERLDPRWTETFGIVILADVLEHVYHWQKGLDEARRILKIGGGLIITVPTSGRDVVADDALPLERERHGGNEPGETCVSYRSYGTKFPAYVAQIGMRIIHKDHAKGLFWFEAAGVR